jgi:hypothetical protein
VKHVVAFVRFWYDFIVGDDWRVAAGIAVAIAATALLAGGGIAAWWVMPAAVVLVTWLSLRRASSRG